MERDHEQIFGSLESFFVRNIKFDLTKNYEGLAEDTSEYLLFHMSNLRLGLLRDLQDRDKGFTCVKRWERSFSYVEHLAELGYITKNYEVLECYDIPDEDFYDYVDKFMAWLLASFEEQQLILYEVYLAEDYVNAPKTLLSKEQRYEWVRKVNAVIKRAHDYIKVNWPRCHVVEFPQPILGWEGHKWGKYFTHFLEEYYEYAYAAMNVIAKYGNKRREAEQMELQVLKRKYDYIFYRCLTELKLEGAIKNRLDTDDFEVLMRRLDKTMERWTWDRYLRMQNKLMPEILTRLDKTMERWTWDRYLRVQNKLMPEILTRLDKVEKKLEEAKWRK